MENDKQKIQYTKVIIMMVLIWSMFVVSATYILEACGREVNEELTIRIVELIIIAIVAYCVKAFLENRKKK